MGNVPRVSPIALAKRSKKGFCAHDPGRSADTTRDGAHPCGRETIRRRKGVAHARWYLTQLGSHPSKDL